jgi:AcrR family transcriptional regulator
MTVQPLARVQIADIALDLFLARGYDAVSAADIARAAGVSRSTFFRQFGAKEDVIFADHDETVAALEAHLAERARTGSTDAWEDVVSGAMLVLDRFLDRLDSIRRRDDVVRRTPALRDREIVTITRYDRAFDRHLRARLPAVSPIRTVQFADAVAATHNAVLRRVLRDGLGPADARDRLARELADLRARLVDGDAGAGESVVVAFRSSLPLAELDRRLRKLGDPDRI